MKLARLSLLLLVAACGCSSGGGDYALPTDLCGIKASPDSLRSLLPPGEIEQEKLNLNTTEPIVYSCRIQVDQVAAIAITVRAFSDPMVFDLMESYRAAPSAYNIWSPYEDVIGGQDAILDSGGSFVRTSCPMEGEIEVLEINVRNYVAESETAEGRERMKDFTAAFMASAKEEFGC
ncbi:hypothetical protein ACFV5N_10240 [Streptomyces sp. NPDC059853]|uniref:hypothetical protein n=1 Tax=Streptomyces sp. NPDC059853 TaxID=3346973 RepID=UPI003661FADE